jgi:hypothetical protein
MKIATVRAYLDKTHDPPQAQARGQGRSLRKAASRALLNLLRDKRLRQQRTVSIHLELVITNKPRDVR